ncbi:MAG TPA: hypothetical protein DIC26_08360 [Pseudomonas sp.]|nr:hypothetical protein [Pseudomonas sp.]
METASECSFTARKLRFLGLFRHRLSLARKIVNRFLSAGGVRRDTQIEEERSYHWCRRCRQGGGP